MAQQVVEYGDPYAITQASTTLNVTDGILVGILVSTSTSGVITITESRSGGRAICTAMPLTAGQFVPIKAKYIGALTLAGGGTFAATLVVNG